jgi:hypothetical protein
MLRSCHCYEAGAIWSQAVPSQRTVAPMTLVGDADADYDLLSGKRTKRSLRESRLGRCNLRGNLQA